jgi:hypothetical protein
LLISVAKESEKDIEGMNKYIFAEKKAEKMAKRNAERRREKF